MYIRKYKTHVFGILVTKPLSKTRQVVLCSNGSNCQLGVSLKLIGDKKILKHNINTQIKHNSLPQTIFFLNRLVILG